MALRTIGLALLVSLAITTLLYRHVSVDGSPVPDDFYDGDSDQVEVIPDTGAYGPKALRINRIGATTGLHDERVWRTRHIVFWQRFCEDRKGYCKARYAGCENAPHFDNNKQCCYADEVLSKKAVIPDIKGEIYVTDERVMCQEQLQKVKVCLKDDDDGGGSSSIEVRKMGMPEVLPGVIDCSIEKKKSSGSGTNGIPLFSAVLLAIVVVASITLPFYRP